MLSLERALAVLERAKAERASRLVLAGMIADAITAAVAEEREACAEVAGDGVRKEDSRDSTEWQKGYTDGYWDAKKAIAAAVRMRGG
jgi:hypothetical protein